MSDFLVVLFIYDEIKEMNFSTLMGKKKKSQHLYLPFYMIGDIWYVKKLDSEDYVVTVNGAEAKEQAIVHGDYIMIQDKRKEQCYSILFSLCKEQRLDFKKYELRQGKNVFIGRSEQMEIYADMTLAMSRNKHAAIRVEEDGAVYVEELTGKIGIYVNGVRVYNHRLKIGDVAYIVGVKIIFLGNYIAVSNNVVHCKLQEYRSFDYRLGSQVRTQKQNAFSRSPRILRNLENDIFEIDRPIAPKKTNRLPMIFTLGPSLTMLMGMLVSLGVAISNAIAGGNKGSLITSLTMVAVMFMGSIIWPRLLENFQKRQELSDEEYRKTKYKKYVAEREEELFAKYTRNKEILEHTLFPEPNEIVSFLDTKESMRRLWERTLDDKDFLELRLGKGNRNFDVKIMVPRQGFVLEEDELAEEPMNLAKKYAQMQQAPVTFSLLEHKTVGLIGNKGNIDNNLRCMLLQIAALHAYDEVKMVFVHNEDQLKEFDWIRELPHTWSTDRSMRYVATNQEEVHQLFNKIDEAIKGKEEDEILPYYIVIIANEEIVQNEPLMRYIEDTKNAVGICSIFAYGDIAKLPKACQVIIQNDQSRCGIYIKNKFDNQFIPFEADEISEKKLNEFARKLSSLPVKVESKLLSTPERVSFLGMYKVANIEELNIERLWHENQSYKSLATPIGIKAGGELFNLDIHENYHGCHGLVAGMTGSGKSEFLQSYIISAALNYHPHDLSFVLIDYKGGGMANIFDGMPHIAGKITNLSGSQLNRSLISIKAELNRRQLLFNEYGLNHIDKYQKLYKEGKASVPLPHLVIISDEFAQLKSQQPDFMRELIDIAQIGRSLGVHLILATQKPAGLVDDQIWSNSKFRVCLKVLDKYDSQEMIKRTDAAMIKQPGRCYVQVGYDEIFEYVQSGYSGIEYIPTEEYIDEESRLVRLVDHTATSLRVAKKAVHAKKSGKTELEAIIDKIKEIAHKKKIDAIPLWLPVLNTEIYQEEVEQLLQPVLQKLEVVVGIGDYPKEQKQLPVTIDFLRDGHVGIYGTSGIGKTTFLQTLLYNLATKLTPEEVNLHIFDFGGRNLGYFNELPHCGGVAFADDQDLVVSTIQHLENIMEKRKVLFSKHNCGTYESYLQATKEKLPVIILVIDNYTAITERYMHLQDNLIRIAANSKTYGIYLVVSGNNKSSINWKVAEHLSSMFTFYLNDPMQYREIFNVSKSLQLELIKGRGLTKTTEVVEFQTALVLRAENESERTAQIINTFKQINENWTGDRIEVGSVSKESRDVVLTSSVTTPIVSNMVTKMNTLRPVANSEDILCLGTGVNDGKTYGKDLKMLQTLFIGGEKNSGKTTLIKALIRQVKQRGLGKVVVVEGESKKIENFVNEVDIDTYITSGETFDSYMKELYQIYETRKKEYSEVSGSELSEEDIYGYMLQYEKLFICIDGFKDFFDMISDEALEKLEKILGNMKGLNIYFITAETFESLMPYSSTELYLHLVKTCVGIVMGGNFKNQSVFSIDEMSALEREKILTTNQGILIDRERYATITVSEQWMK